MTSLDNFKSERDAQLEQLFKDMPTEVETVIKLPSEGRFYENKTPTVTIRPLTFEDEKQLAGNLKGNVNPINLILSRCVKDFPINSMLLIDKLFVLLKIREISYGAGYPASITCPKCNSDSEVKIELNSLVVRDIPSDLEDPRTVILPKLKKPAKARFLRVKDEPFILNQEEIYTNLWRFIPEINGITDPAFIARAISKMTAMDVKTLIKEVMRPDLGLDPRFIFDCASCGHSAEMAVPINENFFSVT